MPLHRIGRAPRRHGIHCRVAILLLPGLLLFTPALAVFAQDVPVRSASDQRFAAHIAEASLRFRIPEHWIRAVLDAESARDIGAVSSAGARGLMQIMPDTWAELRALHRLGDDPFDQRDNILAGTAYLRQMLDRYGSIGAMLAAYNAGPGRYDEYLATGRPLPAESMANRCASWRARREEPRAATGGWQDKGARGARRLGCCISRTCETFLRCASLAPTSPNAHFVSHFNTLVRCAVSRP
ncbi:lytic transglycosylase domain-containing protein [Devosia sp. Root436]|uniref:lytic transglycosylase domain-containing protein n=1 Tax=Devosia sp. Root436 TaxID=1736537 RepID=UPI000A531D51|nr:lytic transglycosylase domain-containing protein [Devosia sp. Root436]